MFKRLIGLIFFCAISMPAHSAEIVDNYLPHTDACQDFARWISYCYETHDPNVCFGGGVRGGDCIFHKGPPDPTYVPLPPSNWKPSWVSS